MWHVVKSSSSGVISQIHVHGKKIHIKIMRNYIFFTTNKISRSVTILGQLSIRFTK